GGAGRRHGGEDRPLGGEVLEDLPRQNRCPSLARLRQEQEQRLGVALVSERAPAGAERQQLEAVAELQRLGPLAIARRELADEAADHALEPRLLESCQERPGVPLAEEAARVGDPETVAGMVGQTLEVVIVGA